MESKNLSCIDSVAAALITQDNVASTAPNLQCGHVSCHSGPALRWGHRVGGALTPDGEEEGGLLLSARTPLHTSSSSQTYPTPRDASRASSGTADDHDGASAMCRVKGPTTLQQQEPNISTGHRENRFKMMDSNPHGPKYCPHQQHSSPTPSNTGIQPNSRAPLSNFPYTRLGAVGKQQGVHGAVLHRYRHHVHLETQSASAGSLLDSSTDDTLGVGGGDSDISLPTFGRGPLFDGGHHTITVTSNADGIIAPTRSSETSLSSGDDDATVSSGFIVPSIRRRGRNNKVSQFDEIQGLIDGVSALPVALPPYIQHVGTPSSSPPHRYRHDPSVSPATTATSASELLWASLLAGGSAVVVIPPLVEYQPPPRSPHFPYTNAYHEWGVVADEDSRLEERVHKQLWADSERRHQLHYNVTATNPNPTDTSTSNNHNISVSTNAKSTHPISARKIGLNVKEGDGAVTLLAKCGRTMLGTAHQQQAAARKKKMLTAWCRDAERAQKMALVVTGWMDDCVVDLVQTDVATTSAHLPPPHNDI